MTESSPRTSGTQALRPKARILRTFGDELISSETVAVIELVKNAYDADATRVLIKFQEPLGAGEGSIEIIDNGHGMDLNTIQTAWLEPATLYRKRRPKSKRFNRRVLGEKGIGRFATSRLADWLEVITRHDAADYETRVLFDWSQFDDENKYLDQIEVLWEQTEPEDICPDGLIQILWNANEDVSTKELTHGTILKMEKLRSTWSEKQLKDLRTGLSRLVSPFIVSNRPYEESGFQIRLQMPSSYEHLSGIVEAPESLRSPHYILSGAIDENGNYRLDLQFQRQNIKKTIEGQFILDDEGQKPRCGPFQIELRVWDRDQGAMKSLAHQYGSTVSDVRRDLDEAAGISIYRDGFRVMPYGDPENDWLRLDLRRVQNPTLRLSNNQIVGHILISADLNPQLTDQTNREGLRAVPALDDFRKLIRLALAELETHRYAQRPRRQQPKTQSGGLFADFNLTNVQDFVNREYPNDSRLHALVKTKNEDLERRVEEVQRVLSRYRRLATLGQLIDTVLHEGRAPLSKIGNEAVLGKRDLNRLKEKYIELIDKLNKRLDTIHTQSDALATVFRKIEPFGGRKRGRPARIRLESIIADAFFVLEAEIERTGVQVNLPKTTTQVTVDRSEIQEVIINLLQNSLYWLRKVPKESRQIDVQIYRINPTEVEIIFSDSGPGIKAEFQEKIFDPYFSTKPDGVGLGLTIAGEIVSEYYEGDLELINNNSLSGAAFRITLRRRV